MFTGIVEETGTIATRRRDSDGLRLSISAPTVVESLSPGDSISVSGVCLTVETTTDDRFDVFVSQETVDRTYLDELAEGDGVNLERAMAASGRFDGHIVQGHVDAVATVEAIEPVEEDWYFTISLPDGFERYVVEKGSITIDGISLTVVECVDASVRIAIIPMTYEITTLSEKAVGDPVHLEVDVLAKYVERILENRSS